MMSREQPDTVSENLGDRPYHSVEKLKMIVQCPNMLSIRCTDSCSRNKCVFVERFIQSLGQEW